MSFTNTTHLIDAQIKAAFSAGGRTRNIGKRGQAIVTPDMVVISYASTDVARWEPSTRTLTLRADGWYTPTTRRWMASAIEGVTGQPAHLGGDKTKHGLGAMSGTGGVYRIGDTNVIDTTDGPVTVHYVG